MTDPIRSQRSGLIQRFLGKLRYPQLFVLMAALFAVDMIVPDFIPFLDEILLAAGTLLLGSLRDRSSQTPEASDKPPEKNITPTD
jgi:hypothetical protein